ncbi:hypothetical protein Aspvir_007908 [Aspergillus viridinutans]|uniref:Uncharacterized protein n=1 Tax=Aspergillus viridinutans TaxID=75553 RepID=A0A9P3BWK8_ASPVI|nr:uncharacterized protein Aspvir_007908 [Aspergillus viridinutans]GIK03833.1 hypothetical protein Aspvir_007908 [Aspergillus viridinutans]
MALIRPSVRALPRRCLIIHRNSTTPKDKKKGPLTGITVVSLEQAISAPFCTRQLADLGARVIKIERPKVGDFARNYDTRVNGLSSHFVWTNRSKESLALNVKNPRHHRILMRLLSRADILVQNLAPGASARLGLSFADLSEKHPYLIVCNISGYGPDGPYRDKKAYDLLIQSEAGLLSVTGTGTERRKSASRLRTSARREKDPERHGRNIDISMLESMVEWMGFPMYYTYGGQPGPIPAGASHAAIYPYGPFETGKGTVMLGIQNEREWAKFCEMVLEKPEMAMDERFSNNSLRVKNRAELRETICNVFTSYSTEGILRRLDEAVIANASVNDMQGVWNHPQLRARQRWTQVQTSAGTVPALFPPGMGPDGFEAQMGAVPEVGQHNEAILAELGMDMDLD